MQEEQLLVPSFLKTVPSGTTHFLNWLSSALEPTEAALAASSRPIRTSWGPHSPAPEPGPPSQTGGGEVLPRQEAGGWPCPRPHGAAAPTMCQHLTRTLQGSGPICRGKETLTHSLTSAAFSELIIAFWLPFATRS